MSDTPPEQPKPEQTPPEQQPPEPKIKDDWAPPPADGYRVREERAPILRYVLALVILAAIGGLAIWVSTIALNRNSASDTPRDASETVITVDTDENKAPQPPKNSDDEAWARALELDTLEGYRAYLDAYPEGRHKDKAQAEIDRYDDEAWSRAEQRNTISGYQDYLEAWPDGRHASQARERLEAMKAEAEARQRDAAERAAQEAADWQRAAAANTVASYDTYLGRHPTGANADEAMRRRDELKADAADRAAWQQAEALNTAIGYDQYLRSFPQGAFAMQARTALERLRPAVGKTLKDCAACPQMMVLPSGAATLGAVSGDGAARPTEGPARPITFSAPFAISVYEVTFTEWQACVSAGGCQAISRDNGWGQGRRPVINVSWTQAQAYASWLSQQTGQTYSLPSEAQWEYAARGGDSAALAGGGKAGICALANGAAQEIGNLAWANTECTDPMGDRTMPVGSLGANTFGLHDMIGNVAEWTMDCSTLNLRDAPVNGTPDQRGSCNQRVTRGGSWFSGPDDLRYSARLPLRLGDKNDVTGFRVVRTIGP
jgi:formylglycine-generating enzyme required for sulfatase activity